MAKQQQYDPRTDPDVPKGMSIELLQDLHLLTRDGQLNADARRKLKQIRHLVGLLKPALDDALARSPEPSIVDCGAGKSYLGALLYELVLGPAGRGTLTAIEARPELSEQAANRAKRFGQERFKVATGTIGSFIAPPGSASSSSGSPSSSSGAASVARPNVLTALHACDTATDDALVLAIANGADHVAVVPCCQAEVARQLEASKPDDAVLASLFAHPLHRRELGSHLTNVIRALTLEAHGYKVTVTELVGWEHSAKNELILGKRVQRFDRRARETLRTLLDRFHVEPALIRELTARNLDPRKDAST
ncbi:MAG TPA: SAM-dependent methyltransferase [Kofleriaceae bacterium]|nr:SAM-dependent methyltransferase [Kofleriaceae bacterium]